MDDKKKKMLIGGAAMLGVLVTGVGATVAIMSGNKESAGKAGYTTATPTVADTQAQPGQLSIEPIPVALGRTPDGQIQAIATVSALFQDFTVGTVQISGDQRLSWKSDCLKQGAVIPAGQRCNVTITFDAGKAASPVPTAAPAAPLGSATPQPVSDPTSNITPELVIMGNSKTPGGQVLPIEQRAQITNADPNAPMQTAGMLPGGVAGAPGSVPAGTPAPNGLDPYGPVAPVAPTAGTASGNALPVAPAADATGGGSSSSANVAAGPAPLSPREQFMLARRQAVLNRIPARGPSAQQQQKPYGTWADLNIPTATSSLPQDMSRVVTMDRVITAVLVRPYDSRSSQQVVAQVDRNVYGAMGRNVLIPRGSQIIGIAQGGAERVAIQWKQIIRPDGARFVMEASAADAMGQAGVPGRINQRLLKRYGSILLGTVLKAGTAKVFDAAETPSDGVQVGGSGSSSARNNGAIVTDIVRGDIERIVADIVQRNQQIQPIITVPAGTRITVIPTMDLQMRPLQGPVEEVRSYPRRQNGGAPAGGGDDEGGFDAPQPRNSQRRNTESPLPSEDVPSTGSTPPWDSN